MTADHSSNEEIAAPRRGSDEYSEGYAEARRAFLVRCHGRQTVRMAGGARPFDTGEPRVVDLLLVEDFGAPALREQARGASVVALRLRMPVRVPGPEPRCFTCLWPAPRIPSGPAGALHGVPIGIRGRYPSWSRRRVR